MPKDHISFRLNKGIKRKIKDLKDPLGAETDAAVIEWMVNYIHFNLIPEKPETEKPLTVSPDNNPGNSNVPENDTKNNFFTVSQNRSTTKTEEKDPNIWPGGPVDLSTALKVKSMNINDQGAKE